jgi:dienelactone hydrolase
MQHDITDGVKYLIAQGIADPKRVAIFGGSYGGYATLAGVAFTPDLYAAGVSYVGPSNIITLLKTIPPYWAPMKRTFDVRVGNMDNPEDRKMLEAASPLNFAKNIKAPLLVIQGANDPRVKKAESDQIVVALRDLGRPVEYVVAPDEGHGFAGRENRMAAFTAMEKFFSKHLSGRYQESILPEVQKRLGVLTVDIATVKMPEQPKASGPAEPAVADPSKLKAEVLNYSTTFSAMGQKFTMNSKRTIQQADVNGKKVWRVIDQSSGMMGSGVDTLDLDAATLYSTQRSAAQGPTTIALTFTNTSVKGLVKSPRGDAQIDAASTGPVVSDGGGVDVLLGALPLTDGYRAGINLFDMMSRKVQPMVVAVVSKEKAGTSAGEFDAYKVTVTPADGDGSASTYWVAADRRIVVRTEMELPAAMGGGKAVTELTK